MSFELSGVGKRYGSRVVLEGIRTRFETGRLTAIAGPNGAGKSTLLNVMAGIAGEFEGRCVYAGRDLRNWPRREFAQRVAFVPQSLRIEFPFTAGQVVMMGRAPHAGRMFEGPADRAAVDRALEMTDAAQLRDRDFRTLSGGERQRVVLASALAQSPEFLLLDEPATFLDLRHQVGMFRVIRGLCAAGAGVVAVTHDLNTALNYADRAVLLEGGRIAAEGAPGEVLTPARIRAVFGVEARVEDGGPGWIRYEP